MADQNQQSQDRMAVLNKIGKNLPIVNQNLEKQRQAALSMQTNAMIGQMPQSARAAQAAAGQVAGARVQSNLQTQANTQSQLGQLGQSKIQEQELQNTATIQERAKTQAAIFRDQEAKFAKMAGAEQKKLLDNSMQFNQDYRGSTLLSEQNILDWAKANNLEENQQKQILQTMELNEQKRAQLKDAAHTRIVKELEYLSRKGINEKNNRQAAELAKAAAEMKKSMAKDAANAANRRSMFAAGGTIAGAAIGTFIAPGVGTAVGASLGGAVGTGLAGM